MNRMSVRLLGTTARHTVPAKRPFQVERPHLVERLHGSIGLGLTVLQAPGGYGKSTLAAEFIQQLEFAPRWLALDSSAQSPEVFAEQLVRAMLGAGAWAPASTETEGALHSYLGSALREFEESSSVPMMLVLDNAHELLASEASLDLLEWFLGSVPAGSEVLLATREPLPLPELDRRLVGGEATLLQAADLAFTIEEAAELLVVANRPDLEAQSLLASTGGWPVAVRGVLAGTISQEGAARLVAGGAWDRYIAGEVWASVPAHLREALLKASVPPAAEREIVAELLDAATWTSLGEWLDSRDFFSERMANGDRRLTPVVQQFLRVKFRETAASDYEAAIATTISALEHAGRLVDALELAATLESHQDSVQLLHRHGPALLQRGSYTLMQRTIAGLPTAVAKADSIIVAFRSRVESHIGDPADALEAAQSVGANDAASAEAHHHARLARARALRLLGRFTEVREALDAPLDDIPADIGLQAELAWHRAHEALATDSDLDSAQELLERSLELARDARSPLLELLCRSTIGQVMAMKGDGPAGVTELTTAARGWRALQGSAHLAWVLNNLGMAHLLVGDFESAVSSLSEAREESLVARNRRSEAFTTASLGDAYLAFGDATRAYEHYEKAISVCAEYPVDESLVALSTAGLSAALLAQGNVEQADFLARRAVAAADGIGSPFELASCLLQQAAVASAAEFHGQAVELAERAAILFAGVGADAALRTARYRLALIHFRDGNREAAEAELKSLSNMLTAPWMVRGLAPMVREHTLFAQWVDSRSALSPSFKRMLGELAARGEHTTLSTASHGNLPRVVARSLGALRVLVDGREVSDDQWESLRAKEMFFLLLAHPDGMRKEEVYETLYPDMPAARCNSQFHSNLYRVRKALYKDSVIKRDGAYMLNPKAEFSWDVREFQAAVEQAAELPTGSQERASAYEKALQLYRGPFAEAFFSEWAASLRDQVARKSSEALSTLAGFYAGREQFDAAIQCLERVLANDSFNDEAVFQLASYQARAGRPTAALAFLDEYSRDLGKELGVPMPKRLSELRHGIASGAAI